MKKLLLFIGISLSLTLNSCSSDALNVNLCKENIKKQFPNCQILSSPNWNRFKFIVKDSLNIYEVETMNLTNSEISQINILK